MSCACTPPQATTVPKMSTPPHSRSASTTPPSTPRAEAPGLSTPVLLLMAVACGLCAGSNYFNQPLLHSIATQLQVRDASAALIVTLAQVDYAAGLVFLVQLGDVLERRRLIPTLMLLAALGLFTSGFAGSYTLLALGTVLTGLFSVAAQVLVPLAATLAAPGRSGRAVGLVMSGLLVGILAARSVAGLLSELGGWTLVYRVAGVAMVAVALALWWAMPRSRNAGRAQGYGQVLRSLGTLALRHPRLRSRALLGGLSFASVSVLFSTMALLLAGACPPPGRCGHRPGGAGGRGRCAHGQCGGPHGRPWSGPGGHGRFGGVAAAGLGRALAGRHQPGVVCSGHAGGGPGAAGRAHQQSERDLPAGPHGPRAHQRGVHDQLLHRRGQRVGARVCGLAVGRLGRHLCAGWGHRGAQRPGAGA